MNVLLLSMPEVGRGGPPFLGQRTPLPEMPPRGRIGLQHHGHLVDGDGASSPSLVQFCSTLHPGAVNDGRVTGS